MAYSSDNTGVYGYLGEDMDGTTIPTDAEVTNMRADIAREIDSVLKARGYTVPATGANDVALLSYYEDLGAAVRAWQARYHGTITDPRVQNWHDDYQAFLNRLRQGQQDLIDQAAEGDLEPYFVTAQAIRRDGYFVPEEVD